MTEHNHRRGKRGRSGGTRYGRLPCGTGKFWQSVAHRKRRQLVRKLLVHERAEDIPGNTPKHVRWDYW